MFKNTMRPAGLGGALLAMAVLVGCATTEEPAPAPAPALELAVHVEERAHH